MKRWFLVVFLFLSAFIDFYAILSLNVIKTNILVFLLSPILFLLLYFLLKKPNEKTFFIVLFLIKALFLFYLFNSGFRGVSADEYARALGAYSWSLNPSLMLGGSWLAFNYYFNGFFMMFWDNIILVSVFSSFITSCFLLVYFYKIIKYVFKNELVAYLSVFLLFFYKWYVWLGGVPLADIYYVTFLIVGVYHLIVWVKEEKKGYLFLASLFFICSSGFHQQSWVFINVIGFMMFLFLISLVKNKNFVKSGKVIIFIILNNLYVFIHFLTYLTRTGSINVFAKHTEMTQIVKGFVEESLIKKLWFYPNLLLDNGYFLFWFLLIVGIFYFFKNEKFKKNIIKYEFIFFFIVSLIIFSLFNVFSVPSLAAVGRFSFLFIIVLVPFCAYGLYHIFSDNKKRRIILTLVIFLIFIINISSCFNFTNKWMDGFGVGSYLDAIFDENSKDYVVLEVAEGFSDLSVRVSAKHLNKILKDREDVAWWNKEENPSYLLGDNVSVFLLDNNVGFIVVKSEELKKILESFYFTYELKEIDGWSVYGVDFDNSSVLDYKESEVLAFS